MDSQKALDRIRKLLRLARDPAATPAEAETALLQAQRIMAERGIADGEVVETSTTEETIADQDVAAVRRRDFWRGRLAVVIAKNFRCKTYWMRRPDGLSGVHFLGRTGDVAIAGEVYVAAVDVALAQVAIFARARRGGGVRARNAFLAGFADGLAMKFDEQVVEMTAASRALVVVADGAVEAKFNELRLRAGRRSGSGLHDPTAREAGERAGRAFQLHRDRLRTG